MNILIRLVGRYVLPNHYLFVLAEKPPADMAALLSLFHPVPPVVRRRSKELLDAIRGAAKNVQDAAKAQAAPEATLAPADAPVAEAAAQEEVEMDVAEAAAPSSGRAEASSTDLWAHSAYLIVPRSEGIPTDRSTASRAPKAGAAESALLGNPVVVKVEVKGAAVFAAPSSALFGGASRVGKACSL